jgi:hypothetical protein
MKKILLIVKVVLLLSSQLQAQVEPNAGNWKTWLVPSAKDFRAAQPGAYKTEIADVIAAQQNMDAAGRQQVQFWSAGAPGFRWQEIMNKLWTVDTSSRGVLANMLLGASIYDATVAAWDSKYSFNRPRPFSADKRIKLLVPNPESPSYPCEHSVAAGVAVTIISQFYPKLADSVNRMAQRLMAARIAAGTAFPSDTRAGFELGKKVALQAIERTKDFITTTYWDGKKPQGRQYWNGAFAMFPTAGLNKTVVLTSGSQFRPAPPPDFTKDMAELKAFKQTFRSQANAFYFAEFRR